MNAELNINNKKKLGKDMMSHSEECKAIAREQYGSRKQHKLMTDHGF
jgi:hypothetical protein